MRMINLGLVTRMLVALSLTGIAYAVETVSEKAADSVDSVKTDAKVGARNAKKKMRNATCTDADKADGKCGVAQDMKDSAENGSDHVKHEAKKLKNKVD